jgi:hypothetical protein
MYSLNNTNFYTSPENAAVKATNAGNYTMYYFVAHDGTTTFIDSPVASVPVTIAKAAATGTAPTARTLTYTGSAQQLADAGSTSHGTMTYSLTQGGTYGAITSITGTNAVAYSVWYKITGDANHNNTAAAYISVSIAKATLTVVEPTTRGTLPFTGSAQTLYNAGSVTAPGVLTMNGTTSATGVENYTMTWTISYDSENYVLSGGAASGSFNASISPVAATVTVAPEVRDLTYNGVSQVLVTAGSAAGGTMWYRIGSGVWSTNLPSSREPGEYTISYKVTGDSNHTDVAEITLPVKSVIKLNLTVNVVKTVGATPNLRVWLNENMSTNGTGNTLSLNGIVTNIGTIKATIDNPNGRYYYISGTAIGTGVLLTPNSATTLTLMNLGDITATTLNVYVYELYEMTYNANNSQDAPPVAEFKRHGEAYILKENTLSMTYGTPDGWNTVASGGGVSTESPTAVMSGGSYTTNANTTFYAQWLIVVPTTKTIIWLVGNEELASTVVDNGAIILLPALDAPKALEVLGGQYVVAWKLTSGEYVPGTGYHWGMTAQASYVFYAHLSSAFARYKFTNLGEVVQDVTVGKNAERYMALSGLNESDLNSFNYTQWLNSDEASLTNDGSYSFANVTDDSGNNSGNNTEDNIENGVGMGTLGMILIVLGVLGLGTVGFLVMKDKGIIKLGNRAAAKSKSEVQFYDEE